MTAEQAEAYALHVRISEITQKLEMDDIVPADPVRRSPSPTPEYDMSGRRINARHQRYRGSLAAEHQSLISQAVQVMPNYRPPAGFRYTTPSRITEKLYIPVKDFPKVNFIGQILGPRGRSLMETAAASGATIALRGKGSVKEGRGRANNSKLRDDMYSSFLSEVYPRR
jgi:splicing factor 1